MEWSKCRAIPAKMTITAFALGVLVSSTTSGAAENVWAPRVTAEFKVNVAGIDLGTFNFVSTMKERSYSLAGYAKLTWGFGLLSWTGRSSSNGTLGLESVAERAIRPGDYRYEYNSKKRSGGVRIEFGQSGVKDFKVNPPAEPSAEIVPIRPQHLEGVHDPMSALVALSHGSSANPCSRRVGVFDGKHRFDIELSHRRQERVVEKKPSGQPALAYVCRVRYIPVAGHKQSREVREMARNDRIEVAMRPVPAANVFVPYRIAIPTSIGTTYIYARRVEIVTPGRQTIALAH